MINWVTIPRFCELSGYTDKAVRAKMSEGVWLQNVIWRKAPDNRTSQAQRRLEPLTLVPQTLRKPLVNMFMRGLRHR